MSGWQARRVGHKGADMIAPGNTFESFDAALAAGVDMIEFDVLPERASTAPEGCCWHTTTTTPRPARRRRWTRAWITSPRTGSTASSCSST